MAIISKLKKKKNFLTVGTWNVRTLVESTGDERVCRKRVVGERVESDTVDRKLDLVVRELKRYGVAVAGIQESRWFGSDVWDAGEYTFLHSGRPLPDAGASALRNEGVGIALDKVATEAWKNAGEKWEAVSSRIVMARLKWLKLEKKRWRQHETHVSIVCAYAPTAKAPPDIKQTFYLDLQDTIDKIPTTDVLVMLGDFNARVGILESGSDEWQGILGTHGKSERNPAGVDFLEFCAVNELSIMNTWYQKKVIHQGTWTHPATKQCHTIDFVVMRASQRAHCRDVQVMRGASCWTDHKLVRSKLNIKVTHPRRRKEMSSLPFAVHELAMSTKREEYRRALEQQLRDKQHSDDATSKQNWDMLKECIVSAAEETVGRGRRKHPEWFEESSDTLLPLIEAKNRAHQKMLQCNATTDRKEFRKHQRLVKRAVDKAKEDWICRVAKEAEVAVKDGRVRWERIRSLQKTHMGRKTIKPRSVWKEDGMLTQGSEDLANRWSQHFQKFSISHQSIETR